MRLNKNNWLVVIVCAVLYGCTDNEPTGDFDLVCQYFQELGQLEDASEMTAEQRNEFIVGKLDRNIPSSSATISWEVISYADPEDRYEIFKTGAESELGRKWHCSSMEELAPLTGINE